MALGKQAKTLNEKQQRFVLSHIDETRDAIRNRVMFLLSVDAGLRAKEIASVEWRMVLDAEGNLTDAIRLENKSAKVSQRKTKKGVPAGKSLFFFSAPQE